MLDDDRTAQMTCHCTFREDVFPMKQGQTVVLVSSTEPAKSLLNSCPDGAVVYVLGGHGAAVLDWAGKSVTREEDASHGSLVDSY